MSQADDEILIRQAREGDQVAFGKLVKRYYEMVYAVAVGVLHHHEMARDVTQDVFLKVFRNLQQFEGKAKFKTWLYRVAMNAALDEARKKKPVESLEGQEDEEGESRPMQIAAKNEDPIEKLSRQELAERMGKALESLSPDHRAILVLREWEELSYQEIADMLHLEIGTVMSRLHYAKKKLGEILKEQKE